MSLRDIFLPAHRLSLFSFSAIFFFLLLGLSFSPGKHAQELPTLDSEEQNFIALINTYRAQNGLAPLQVSIALTNSSKWMSADMASRSYFAHTDSLGRDPFVRMADFGYNYNAWRGENIAAGFSTAADTFTQWRVSPGHNQNMLNSSYTVIGVGRVYWPGSTYSYYWTTDFGGYVDQTFGTAPPPSPTPQPTPAPQPTGINLAAGKAAYTSSFRSWWGDMSGRAAIDGDEGTMWHSESNLNQLEYLQVDLGQAALLSSVVIVFRRDQDQPITRKNFAVYGSNDPSFQSNVVLLAAQGSNPAPFAQPWTVNVSATQGFRYVRVAKTVIDRDQSGQSFWNLNEVRIFGTPGGN